MPTSALALVLTLLAPDFPGEAKPGSPGAEAEQQPPDEADPAAADPYYEQAPLDVETILADSSKAYLEARARLEGHPELASEAILDRLTTVPPPTSTDRKRLLDVLAALGLTDHVELFAKELRRAVVRADSFTDESKAIERWLPLILEQGPAARPTLTRLIADKEIPVTGRATLLDGLVEVTPAEDLGELVVLVGRGAKTLRRQLHRSLQRRASRDEAAQATLVRATEAALAEAEPKRVPALLSLRGAIATDGDLAFTRTVGALAQDDASPFPVRVAALRALAGQDSAPAHEVLEQIASHSLAPERRGTQRAEVLAWLALSGLPTPRAKGLVEQHDLVHADAPRLASLGFAHATLAADQSWLPAALDNPWPQVRQAAIARVEGTCVPGTEKLLEQKGHLAGRRSEDDRAVARSAIQALGRCKTSPRLRRLLVDEDLDIELRSEAARQLARLGDDASIEAIGDVLRRNPDRAFARRLASALRHMPQPTAAGDALLCEVATRPDEAGHAARESLLTLHGDLRAACEE